MNCDCVFFSKITLHVSGTLFNNFWIHLVATESWLSDCLPNKSD
ncbi:unnamed protein product [Callosobruchus maculatus]|uniref:Uncharacterized protein n=1 Tax=Callosobruchus maculatus TaxID=64391 RepID=A0A653CBA8_CALMS|nr:unnamed protein product [Callosobruchus maculatus]